MAAAEAGSARRLDTPSLSEPVCPGSADVVGQIGLVPHGDELIDVDDLTENLLGALDENLLVHTCALAVSCEVVVGAVGCSSELVWAGSPAPWLLRPWDGDVVGNRRGRTERRAFPNCCNLMHQVCLQGRVRIRPEAVLIVCHGPFSTSADVPCQPLDVSGASPPRVMVNSAQRLGSA